ncbi:DNA polymerase I [bacterium]|nr:DNA polymerase I [bacterium]
MTNKIYLIDGAGYIFRAYYALQRMNLMSSKGEPTGAINTFTSMLLKLLDEEKPEYVAVIFDLPGPTFRHEIYQDYKANRKETPEDLVSQFPHIRNIVDYLNIKKYEREGYEADDIIATIARRCAREGMEVVIVSGDKDMCQLVSDKIKLLDTMKSPELIDETKVIEKWGVPPDKFTELQGLMGDTSDNIPGIPGIGPKTATKLIAEYGTIENLFNNRHKIKGKLHDLVQEYYEQAIISRKLAEMREIDDFDFHLDDIAKKEPNLERLIRLLKNLQLQKHLARFTENIERKIDYKIVSTPEELDLFLNELKAQKTFSIDTETTSEFPVQAELVGISFSWEKDKGYYIPVGHVYQDMTQKQLPRNMVLEKLKPILESDDYKKIGQNIKYDYIVFRNYGIFMKNIEFDTMLASYVMNPEKHQHNLNALALEHLDHKMIPFSDLVSKKTGKNNFSEVDIQSATEYSCEDADITLQLKEKFEPVLEKRSLKNLFHELEMPLIEVLAEMEITGIKINPAIFHDLRIELTAKLNDLEKQIFDIAGFNFNINSPQQLAEVLFSKLNLPVIKKSKTGPSTDFKVLKQLSAMHPVPNMILEYRSLAKLLSTYINALPMLVNPKSGRIHTSFNQTVAATGRLSSSDPNMQNIPVRTPDGRKIRQGFIPDQGCKFISADYSQIELRILAHITQDKELIDAYNNNLDVHARTASALFGVPEDQVTPKMRDNAKTVNFGIIYGMSAFRLNTELDIPMQEAQRYVNEYFKKYAGVKEYIEITKEFARKHGYVETLMGRRRYTPEINSKNFNIREGAGREAVNTTIQGTAADLIKVAMLNIYKKLKAENKVNRMILQVHDELLFEVPESDVEPMKSLIKSEMESAISLSIPLKVTMGVGNNWDEAH